jgi:hypothetical protein
MDTPNLPATQPAEEHADRLRRLTRQLAGQLAYRLRIQPHPSAEQIVDEGLARVRRTINRYHHGAAVDDAIAIRLAMDLQIIRIRDEAWLAVPAALSL